jgi:hypothetical protein
MGSMQEIPERDWVTEEAEALLAADPTLRESLERQMAESRAGTLRTVDTATVRRMLDERAPRRERRQHL